jgi:hypothetical protein
MDSLDLLLDTLGVERAHQLTHFDALDAKAGITLGFSGALIALAPDVMWPFRLTTLLLLVASAICSVAAFWPRRLPTLEVGALRAYLRADVDFTKLTLHDTYISMVVEGWTASQTKVRLLRAAMTSLAVAGLTLASGIALGGGHA